MAINFFVDDEILGLELDIFTAAATDLGAPLVGELLGDLAQFAADHAPQLALVLEDGLDLLGTRPFGGELVENDLNLQTRELVQLQLQDRVGLLFVEAKTLDDLARGVRFPVGLADDANRFVQRIEDDREAFQDVDTPAQLRQLELEATPDDFLAKVEELAQDLQKVELHRPRHLAVLRRHEAGHVHVE
jgi:hypothetical protein